MADRPAQSTGAGPRRCPSSFTDRNDGHLLIECDGYFDHDGSHANSEYQAEWTDDLTKPYHGQFPPGAAVQRPCLADRIEAGAEALWQDILRVGREAGIEVVVPPEMQDQKGRPNYLRNSARLVLEAAGDAEGAKK